MGHAKQAAWVRPFSVVVLAAALCPTGRAGAQGICEDVGISAILGNCTKPGPEWQLTGQYACAVSVTTSADGSCWLQLSSGDPESPCALRHSEPTIADAPAYQFETRFMLVNSGPECDQCGTAATLAVSDGERMFDLMVQSGDPGTLRVGLGAKGGEPSVTFDSTTPHVLHADVSRDGVASVLLDGAPVASVAYADLPLVPPGNVLPTWEVVNDILGNLDIDYARFDVCASEPPPSNQVQVTKTKTMPRPYIPGQKVLTITTDAIVADVRPSGPDPKAVFSLEVTQTLVATASQQALGKSEVTTPLDFSTIALGAQLPVSSSWQWDGHTPSGDLAPRGWMTIKTRADLMQTLNGSSARVATNYGTKDVWIGPTLRQWGLRPPTRMASPVFDKTYSLPAGTGALPNKVTYTFTASCTVPPVVRVYEAKPGGAWAQSAADLNPTGQLGAFTSVTVNKSARAEQRRVLVHTKSKDATGNCSVTVTCNAPPCSGKPAALDSGAISFPYEPLTNPVITGETLQTALAPGGASDTVLYAVKNSDDRLETALDTILAVDDDSGVGTASRIVLPKDATGYLVVSKAGTSAGECP
jgi:hypothetical protein